MQKDHKPRWDIYYAVVASLLFLGAAKGAPVHRKRVLEFIANHAGHRMVHGKLHPAPPISEHLGDLWGSKDHGDRTVRQAVSRGVQSGEYPTILTSNKGWYLASSPDEVEEAANFIEKYLIASSRRMAGLRKAAAKGRELAARAGEPGQVELFEGSES